MTERTQRALGATPLREAAEGLLSKLEEELVPLMHSYGMGAVCTQVAYDHVRQWGQKLRAALATTPPAMPLREAAERVIRDWDDSVEYLGPAIYALRAALATAPPGREELDILLRDLLGWGAALGAQPEVTLPMEKATALIQNILDLVCGRPGG